MSGDVMGDASSNEPERATLDQAGQNSVTRASDQDTTASDQPQGRRQGQGAPAAPGYSVTLERQVSDQSTVYEGMIPPPADLLRSYEELVPGAAQLIMSWNQEKIQHRRSIELMQVQHEIELENRGMDLGERAMDSGNRRAWTGMFLLFLL